MHFADVVGKVYAIPGKVGSAWIISPGNKHRHVTVTEIYSNRRWEEFWGYGDGDSGLARSIKRGELVEIVVERV